jgi:hypothetical protein
LQNYLPTFSFFHQTKLRYNHFVMEKFTIICPCCETTLTIDAQTGAMISHEEKKKILGSFEDLKGNLVKQKEQRDNIFAQEMSSMKDRERLLDEKFKEAMKRAGDETLSPYKNPLDMD